MRHQSGDGEPHAQGSSAQPGAWWKDRQVGARRSVGVVVKRECPSSPSGKHWVIHESVLGDQCIWCMLSPIATGELPPGVHGTRPRADAQTVHNPGVPPIMHK